MDRASTSGPTVPSIEEASFSVDSMAVACNSRLVSCVSLVCSRLVSCVSACVSNAHLVCPPFLRTSRLACIARTDWHAHGLGMAVVHTRMQAYSTKNTSYTGNGIKGSS